MPEGHTIHRLARDHRKWFAGQTLAISSPQGRFEDGARRIDGRRLHDVSAHGKHLFYRFRSGPTVHVHLGLFGRFRRHKSPPPQPRGAVRMRVVGTDRAFDLSGPTACEVLDDEDVTAIRSRLGPDPLRADARPGVVRARLAKSRSAIGTLLLNQSVIAGIGNVYRAEILHILGIHPERPGRDLTDDEFNALWRLSTDLLEIGVRYNRIITVDRDQVDRPFSRLKRSQTLRIYKKAACSRCDSPVSSWTLANRTIFACETCQS